MKTYIKKDVVQKAFNQVQPEILDIEQVEKVINATFATLREMMSADKQECRIEIRNFGVFEVKKTKAKPKARNPKTNEIVYVPPRRKTHFKPGKLLQDELKKPLNGKEKSKKARQGCQMGGSQAKMPPESGGHPHGKRTGVEPCQLNQEHSFAGSAVESAVEDLDS